MLATPAEHLLAAPRRGALSWTSSRRWEAGSLQGGRVVAGVPTGEQALPQPGKTSLPASWGSPAALREGPRSLARKRTSPRSKADLGDQVRRTRPKRVAPLQQGLGGAPWAGPLPAPALPAGLVLPGCGSEPLGRWAKTQSWEPPGEKPQPLPARPTAGDLQGGQREGQGGAGRGEEGRAGPGICRPL